MYCMENKQMEIKDVSVIIVIPIYKEYPDAFEDISLRQLFTILVSYQICIVSPEYLNLHQYCKYGDFIVKRFARKYFLNLEGYTQLLLSKEFYACFLNYEYMLVYQTDAFVFSDRLNDFCNLGYDYIGAPIKEFGWDYFHVGNGGFSLRKIKKFYSLLEKKEDILLNFSEKEARLLMHAEDYFFGYCGWNKKIDFTVPSIWIAAQFSVERDVGHGLRRISKEGLPFGCHHWTSMNYQFWKPVIESCGYKLLQRKENWETLETDREKRLELFLFYKLRHKDEKTKFIFHHTGLLDGENYCVWGAGYAGIKCIKLLKYIAVPIVCIYDSSEEKTGEIMNIPVEIPEKKKLLNRKTKIIISTEKYEKEIQDRLISFGLYQNKDFLFFSRIMKKIKANLEKLYPGIYGITENISVKMQTFSCF